MLKILIAEDDLMNADMVQMLLVDAGYEVCGIARTVAEAVALTQRHKPVSSVIFDVLSGMSHCKRRCS